MKTKTSRKTAKTASRRATRAFTKGKTEAEMGYPLQEQIAKATKRPMKNICVCGCGLPCHKLFKQGHDQRARSMYLAGTVTPTLKAAIAKGLLVPKMDPIANAVLKISQKPSKLVKKHKTQTRRAA